MTKINSLKWNLIDSIDLSFIKDRLMKKKEWSAERAENAIIRYKQYLYIVSEEKEGICPTPDTDEVWHEHILHTKQYMDHCNQIFGAILHHQPFSSSEEKRNSTALLLSDLGPKYFGKEYPTKTTESVSVSCCSDDSECCNTQKDIEVE